MSRNVRPAAARAAALFLSTSLVLVAACGENGSPLGPAAVTSGSSSDDAQPPPDGSGASAAGSSSRRWHVSTRGSDGAAGTTPSSAFRTVQKAVGAAAPGDTILVHGGTFDGTVTVNRSGTAGSPIVLTRAHPDSQPVLRAPLPAASCSDTSPARERTLTFTDAASHWVVQGLRIEGGILVEGTNAGVARDYIRDRGVPGRSERDAAAAEGTYDYVGSAPAEGIAILDNVLRGRGVFSLVARKGRIEGNDISVTECSGPGVLLNTFSDKWVIARNRVHDNVATDKHFLNEGIRLGGNSAYNVVRENVVEDVAGEGRGIATDVNASWNLIAGNTVRRTAVNYSEQAGGWGNEWRDNVSESARKQGFGTYGQGGSDARPTDRTPAYLSYECNLSVRDAVSYSAGGVQDSGFRDNGWGSVDLSTSLRSYWEPEGDTWNGSSTPPPTNPPTDSYDRNCGGSPSSPAPPPPPPPPSALSLTATKLKAKGKAQVELRWSGAASSQVEIRRQDALLLTTANDGLHVDALGRRPKGTYRYRVCEPGGAACSPEAAVTF